MYIEMEVQNTHRCVGGGGEGRRGKLTAESYYRMNGAMTPGWQVSHVPS